MKDIKAVVDWLAHGAVSGARSEDVLDEMCRAMLECGVPLWRVAVYVRTPHPDIMGRSFVWQKETGVKVTAAPFELMQTATYLDSPVVAIYASRQPIRRRIAAPDCPDDFPIVSDLRAEGATDYAAFPLLFFDGAVHAATFTTRQPGGFTDKEFADIEAVIAPLARVAEIRALRRTHANLIDSYVGHQAGEKILAGKVRRGDVEAIRAAIWLSDMRSFTALSERLPPRELIDLLNRYFGAQVPAILDHGGEVLKFMGDGLLAIFPIAGEADVAAVCRRALACAREVEAKIAELPPAAENEVTRFRLALHAGEVMYGNIGGGNRLDFTCIGPAVNLAARLEKVAGKLGETIVASADFASQLPDEFARRGEFPVAGFAAPQIVYGLASAAH
jgi:adenylate cyclase